MITARDFKVLEYLFWVGVCDALNIAKLFYLYDNKGKYNKQHMRIARRRLQDMREHGFLKSFPNTDGGPELHTLTNKGILYVGQKLNLNTANVKEKRGYISYSATKHAQALSEVYFSLLEGERMGRYKIIEIRFERANREEFLAGNDIVIIQPDMYIDIGKRYFIEVDNGTMRIPEVKEKLIRYEKWYRRRKDHPTVLFVCNSDKRIKELQNIETKISIKYSTNCYKLYDTMTRIQ